MHTSDPSPVSMESVIEHTSTPTLMAVAVIGIAVLVGGVVLDRVLHHAVG